MPAHATSTREIARRIAISIRVAHEHAQADTAAADELRVQTFVRIDYTEGDETPTFVGAGDDRLIEEDASPTLLAAYAGKLHFTARNCHGAEKVFRWDPDADVVEEVSNTRSCASENDAPRTSVVYAGKLFFGAASPPGGDAFRRDLRPDRGLHALAGGRRRRRVSV